MITLRVGLITLLVMTLAACSSHYVPTRAKYGPTLADLPEPEFPPEPESAPLSSIDDIEGNYRKALSVATDEEIRHRILVRLADLEMARSENTQIESLDEREFYTDAISMYEELIKLNSQQVNVKNLPTNERLLYQLSKAYALDGKIEESNQVLERLVTVFPDSQFQAEADFRRAELAFSDHNYKEADRLYEKVASVGDNTPFYLNSVYMRGWSRFKLNSYSTSIPLFTEVLDRTLAEGQNVDSLNNKQKNLGQDTLRVLSIIFSYLDGAATITEEYNELGRRHYEWMLFANLAQLYFEKDRFRDSADTYLAFVNQFPDSDHSPAFTVKAIEMYSQGDFPSLILPAKEEFVKNYGVYSRYWADRDEEKQKRLRPYLQGYLTELSSYYHAEAQALDDSLTQYEALLKKGKKPKQKPGPSQPVYRRAAALYGEFVLTFPDHSQTPEMLFLKAEALYSGGQLSAAVEDYETVAFTYENQKHGSNAGYAAILTMAELVKGTAQSNDELVQKEHDEWKLHKINTSIKFAERYASDQRAVPVLTKAAEELFDEKDFLRASSIAEQLTQWQPPQSLALQRTAWLVLGHSQYDLGLFAEAQLSYTNLLQKLPQNDPLRADIIDRIAATIYKRAELQIASGDKAGAIDMLLSVRDIAPSSDIATNANYDAINYLMELKDWQRAEQELLRFQQSYPQHELSKTLLPKFAIVYQESEQWGKAAGVLSAMSNSGDPESRRTARYLSAELYERAGDTDKAIEQYKAYANAYPDPFDIATEARFRLTELYGRSKQWRNKDFWLNQLIDADAKAGPKRTNRSKTLAALAMTKFAGDEYANFSAVKLRAPVKKSLKTKKAAMDRALKYYRKIMDFGIADYVTEANHQIALIYSTLAKDLMASERPKGLDDLALEQYEILLEDQAFPFEEKAVDIYEGNTARARKGLYDKWVKKSFAELAKILPARYGKTEKSVEVSDAIF